MFGTRGQQQYFTYGCGMRVTKQTQTTYETFTEI